MGRVRRYWRRVAGTRYRFLTSLVVMGYGVLAVALLVMLAFGGREAVYRVSATTEGFSVTTTRPLSIGQSKIDMSNCPEAALDLPAKTAVKGGLKMTTGQTYVKFTAPAGSIIGATCLGDERLALSDVSLLAPGSSASSPNPASDTPTGRITFRVSGDVAIGGQADKDTPTTAVPLLRSARIVVEVVEWPGRALLPVSERTIEGGGQLTFQGDSGQKDVTAEGLIIMTPTNFQVHVRSRGQGVLYTAPGAESGSEVALAPGFFDRIKAQAHFGVLLVIASLLLGLLEALRAFEAAPDRAKQRTDPFES
jgi:hypothetical protein